MKLFKEAIESQGNEWKVISGLTLAELENYLPVITKRSDFEHFWTETLTKCVATEPTPSFKKVESLLVGVDIWDVEIPGYNNDPIKGWFLTPASQVTPIPCVVQFVGYGGGRGNAQDWLFWPTCGLSILVMDNRGQGGNFSRGETADGNYQYPSHTPGYLTIGIEDKENFYLRRLYCDAVAFVRAAKHLPHVDPNRIITAGFSQGGALSLVAAALEPRVFAAISDVPAYSNFDRAIQVAEEIPYIEIVRYLSVHREKVNIVSETLSYFDVMNLVPLAKNPAYLTVCLRDLIAPPETIFAVRNHYSGRIDTEVWHFNGHEGGGTDQLMKQAEWLIRLISGDGYEESSGDEEI